jgi:hypothetical protein
MWMDLRRRNGIKGFLLAGHIGTAVRGLTLTFKNRSSQPPIFGRAPSLHFTPSSLACPGRLVSWGVCHHCHSAGDWHGWSPAVTTYKPCGIRYGEADRNPHSVKTPLQVKNRFSFPNLPCSCDGGDNTGAGPRRRTIL